MNTLQSSRDFELYVLGSYRIIRASTGMCDYYLTFLNPTTLHYTGHTFQGSVFLYFLSKWWLVLILRQFKVSLLCQALLEQL